MYSVAEKITLSLELLSPHCSDQLWAGLHLYLALQVVMPGPHSPEEMELAASDALRATSPARVNSRRPAVLPAEEAAAPPEICTGSSDPPGSPVPLPDMRSIPLSANRHVSVDWDLPGSSQDKWVDVLVTGLHD